MKTFYSFIIAVVFFSAATAQTIPPEENLTLDQQLTSINQSTVSSGIIYERVLQAANLYNYNTAPFNTATVGYFKQALSEMNRASNGLKFTTIANFGNLIASTTAGNEVDVAILNTQFHILNYNEDSPSQGGLTYNTSLMKFSQIPGKAPFYMLHKTVISPTKEAVSGPNVIYKIRNDLYFKNGTKQIKTLVVNFGDGVNRTIINNQVLTNQNIAINYASSGEKTSTFTATYTDNSVLTTYGKIYYQYVPAGDFVIPAMNGCFSTDQYKEDFVMTANTAFTGYAAGDPKIKAQIEYRVFYGNSDKKIRKPIIIIDGFDPGNKRKIEDCDCESDPVCSARCTTNGAFDPAKHNAMVDMMMYYNPDGTMENLLPKLRGLGYDVILVNHPTYRTMNMLTNQMVTIDGGAYYIESNAMALVKLLTETRAKLLSNGSNSQIAVIGPSMGGQISRYALAYMEKLNLPHHTYLWASIDSPHLGANIPMGDQALLYLLKDAGIEAAKEFYDKELASPAAKQQLIEFHQNHDGHHHVKVENLNAHTTGQGMPSNRGHAFFQQHYFNQSSNGLAGSNGWPVNLRKVAVANGSLSGSKATQSLQGEALEPFPNDGAMVLNLRGFQRVDINLPVGSINYKIHIASLESKFLQSSGSSASRIARFKKAFNNKTVISPNINVRGAMDNVPGGYYGAQNEIAGAVQENDPVPGTSLAYLNNWSFDNFSLENIFKTISEFFGGSEWRLSDYYPFHSFIPTFSAIGHLQPNQNWSTPLDRNLKCATGNVLPFDSYFGLAKNTQHTSFTKESAEWLIKELAGQPQLPWFPVNPAAIVGPAILCAGVNTSYTVSDLCKVPSAATWSVEGNLTLISQTGYSAVIRGNSNAASEGKLIATYVNGNRAVKDIHLGTPTISAYAISGGNGSAAVNSQTVMTVTPATSVTSYQWSIIPMNSPCITSGGLELPGSVLPYATSNGPTSAVIHWGNCTGSFRVRCQAINACGSSYYADKLVTITQPTSPDPCALRMIVSPNPVKNADNEFTVDIVAPIDPEPCPPTGPVIINNLKVFDLTGIMLYSAAHNAASVKVAGLSLKEGYYIIHAELSNGDILKENIIVR